MKREHTWKPSVLGLAGLVFALSASAQVRTFTNPAHEGLAVDYCIADGSICGEDVAKSWCRSQGYEYATEWTAKPGIDFSSATIRLDDGRICRGAQCEAFGAITCGKQGLSVPLTTLGAAAYATVIAPNRSQAIAEVAPTEYRVAMPGCRQGEPGVFACGTDEAYRQCRALMQAGKIFGCRAEFPFADGSAEPIAAEPEDYSLELRSTAQVTVEAGRRGQGKIKGEAHFEISFAIPKLEESVWCLARERYVYHPTGPQGGVAEISDSQVCAAPISGSFAPNEDDLLQAYDLCESFAAWGSQLEQPIELLVAALYRVGSGSPEFRSRHGASAVLAPYTTIRAPMQITCRDRK